MTQSTEHLLDRSGTGDIWHLAKALVLVTDPLGTGQGGADIVNLSLSTVIQTHC